VLKERNRSLPSRRKVQGWLTGYLFVLPVILGLIFFTMGPMLLSLYYSFTSYDILTPPKWTGLENFRRLFTDDTFWISLRVTFRYALISVPLSLILSGLLSILLLRPLHGISIYRAIFYLPVVVPPVATAILFADLYSVRYGVANYLLRSLGLPEYTWISRPETALNALIVMSLWGIGASTIIWLAGLQSIPSNLYDAAEVDGASPLRRFWHVTVPMLTPVIFFNLVIGVITSLQTFIQVFVLTAGGPANSTLFIVLKIYQEGFQNFQMGYASAIAWVFFVIILLLTVLIFRTSGWVYYEGETR